MWHFRCKMHEDQYDMWILLMPRHWWPAVRRVSLLGNYVTVQWDGSATEIHGLVKSWQLSDYPPRKIKVWRDQL